jgi:hypothetical protein
VYPAIEKPEDEEEGSGRRRRGVIKDLKRYKESGYGRPTPQP